MPESSRFVLLALLCSVIGLSTAACGGSSQPNVVVISLDTLRPDRMSLYGHHRPTTPEMDKLARDSVVFEVAVKRRRRNAAEPYDLDDLSVSE